ncbi:hypothetical protein ACOMHN_051990 [Nucella lapillus]
MNIPREGVWVQCVMVFNDFLNNMLLIEWVGMVVMGIITVLSILVWLYWRWNNRSNISFVLSLLASSYHHSTQHPRPVEVQAGKKLPDDGEKVDLSLDSVDWEMEMRDEKKVTRFVLRFLDSDGVFLLRIVKANTNSTMTSELTSQLYKIFYLQEARVTC